MKHLFILSLILSTTTNHSMTRLPYFVSEERLKTMEKEYKLLQLLMEAINKNDSFLTTCFLDILSSSSNPQSKEIALFIQNVMLKRN